MLLALAPMALLVAGGILGMLGYALGLTPPSSEWFSPRLASGLLSAIMLWFISAFVRTMLRDSEQHAAEREARDSLMREQNFELWAARQLHESAVQEKTAEVLATLRRRPLHVRLRTLMRTTP